MRQLVFLLEEPSARAFLLEFMSHSCVLPPDLELKFIIFEGKNDLKKRISLILRKYRNPNAYFIVVQDQDSADCKSLKSELYQKCQSSGKSRFKIRIACRELESWFLGNLQAVSTAYQIPNLSLKQNKAKFRNPDLLGTPSRELEKLIGQYPKIDAARRIGAVMPASGNQSKSFNVFVNCIQQVVTQGFC